MSEKQGEVCPKCNGTGWKPNGDGIWRPFLNDAVPCECGALRETAKKK